MKNPDTVKNAAKLKIGILTFHRCINYGSYWQARCLAEGLQARGHNAIILNHDARRVNIAEWKCGLRPVLPTPVPESDHVLYREKIHKFLQGFNELPLSPPFSLDHPAEMGNYDLVVVGSDEVWNILHPWYGKCPVFYGNGIQARQIISYAASFGNYDVSGGLEAFWAEKLRENFSMISVRDENSQAIIQNALGFEPEMVLDPCLQFPVRPDDRNLDHLEKPYLALYGHNFSHSFACEIRQWAARKKLPLISIGYRNDWADQQWLTADPHDFAHFIAKSQAVITNFFHGCVFALRNAKPFTCQTSPYRKYKLQGLMTKIGGEQHLICEGSQSAVYDAHLGMPLDPEILQKIDRMRKSSERYLDRALVLKPQHATKDLVSPRDLTTSGLCIGCGSCVAQANLPDVTMRFDAYGQLKPGGSSEWLRTATGSTTRTCPFSPEAKTEDALAANLFPGAKAIDSAIGRYESAYVGHVAEEEFRRRGSSGGMVSWMATELLRKGLIDGVAHVVAAEDPQGAGCFFHYRISRTEAGIRAGAKSRYYPIELSEILKMIREVPGRYAVVGIPCFIKAVQLLRCEYPLFRERIRYTLGLFCGHMKSARFVESFAWQMKVPVHQVQEIDYRHKDPGRPANWYTARLTLRDGQVRKRDWWHLVDGDWGAGFFMNSACNFCDDVVAETSDISFGDAWVEPYTSDGRGTNVVVVRSPEMEGLIAAALEEGRLKLEAVDNTFVEQTQAAGFRQRREGLAYRLSWKRKGVRPRKRVAHDSQMPTNHRKVIYRMRYLIAAGSHQAFRIAKQLQKPKLYLHWARSLLSLYHGLAYHKGRFREIKRRFKELKLR